MDIFIPLLVILGLSAGFVALYLGIRKKQGPRDPSAGGYEHADDPDYKDRADWSNVPGTADPDRE